MSKEKALDKPFATDLSNAHSTFDSNTIKASEYIISRIKEADNE